MVRPRAGAAAQDGAVRHPSYRRGGDAGRPAAGLLARAGPRARGRVGARAAAARSVVPPGSALRRHRRPRARPADAQGRRRRHDLERAHARGDADPVGAGALVSRDLLLGPAGLRDPAPRARARGAVGRPRLHLRASAGDAAGRGDRLPVGQHRGHRPGGAVRPAAADAPHADAGRDHAAQRALHRADLGADAGVRRFAS